MILPIEYFRRPCPQVARELVGKLLVHRTPEGTLRLRITETECYCSEADTACHAHRGRTNRTEVLYLPGGVAYIYLCYGMHWLLNIVTGEGEDPQAVLIRACLEAPGPGRLTRKLKIDGSLNRSPISEESGLWVEDDGFLCNVRTDKRVGIGYASQEDQDRLWRFIMEET